jgi:hypothetical protein
VWAGELGECRVAGFRPDGFDVVFKNDRPIVVTYAEAGACVLHQDALGVRPIDLGIFDNELEIAIWFSAADRFGDWSDCL